MKIKDSVRRTGIPELDENVEKPGNEAPEVTSMAEK
jgi:hypothetical protein